MSDLVDRLSNGSHPVSATRYKSDEEFREAVAQGFVLVKFTDTRGGTELGFRIEKDKSELDFSHPSGKLHLVGPLTLDYVPVECVVDLDVRSREGEGALRPRA